MTTHGECGDHGEWNSDPACGIASARRGLGTDDGLVPRGAGGWTTDDGKARKREAEDAKRTSYKLKARVDFFNINGEMPCIFTSVIAYSFIMKTPDYPRLLPPPKRSFFLFGPRGTGKSTWLRRSFPGARHLDLLDSSLFLQLSRQPHDLEMLAGNLGRGGWIILDEVQKTPHLLDEVHRLMETRGWRFALCGSSARKLRRGGVNLLGGRAVTRAMEGLSAQELGKDFDLNFSLEWGMLPAIQTDRNGAADRLAAYVHTYLREEIREEGLIRRLPPFVRFLAIAGQFNGQILNSQGIARDAAIPRSTVDLYFSIMEDTLLGSRRQGTGDRSSEILLVRSWCGACRSRLAA